MNIRNLIVAFAFVVMSVIAGIAGATPAHAADCTITSKPWGERSVTCTQTGGKQFRLSGVCNGEVFTRHGAWKTSGGTSTIWCAAGFKLFYVEFRNAA